MEVKKILWPTDLSKNSARALKTVGSLSKKHGAQVHLLYVVDDVHSFDHYYGDANEEHMKRLQEGENRFAEEWMQHVCDDDLAGCPAYVRHIAKGDPAEQILKAAGELEADLIVMATHGKGGEAREDSFFGSVADRVVKGASLPVVTVPPPAG